MQSVTTNDKMAFKLPPTVCHHHRNEATYLSITGVAEGIIVLIENVFPEFDILQLLFKEAILCEVNVHGLRIEDSMCSN